MATFGAQSGAMTTHTHTSSLDQNPLDSDSRPLFMAATTTATEVIGAIRPEQFDNSSPCPEMNVRQLLGHLVAVVRRVEAMGRDIDAMTVPDSVSVADDEWVPTWRAAVDDADAAWQDEAALERTVVLPWATDSGANALLGYVSELTVHTWDVARATGQQPDWDEETIERAYGLMRRWLPGGHRAETFAKVREQMGVDERTGDAFAEVVPVVDGAPAIDRLVAWTGRRP
ncbi:MAG: hypothetical protein QOE62_2540 [Actinomycetota bacterium]|nr:hypothetical protein [Actinomycetota bacterium]